MSALSATSPRWLRSRTWSRPTSGIRFRRCTDPGARDLLDAADLRPSDRVLLQKSANRVTARPSVRPLWPKETRAVWIAGCMIALREVGVVPSYGQASRPEAVRLGA